MKQGTVSVLFGCHSIFHSILVWVAWCMIYRRPPNFMETVCILLHDIGHWGKDYLDDIKAKEGHAIKGALIARRLFGEDGYWLVIGHNKYLGATTSKLYLADKKAYTIAPTIWLWSNIIFEPRLRRPGLSIRESARLFKKAAQDNEAAGFPDEGHTLYLRQMGKED